MRRPVGRSESLSFRRSRLSVEELECRAQPALLGLSASVHAAVGLEHALDAPAATHAQASASVNVTLPTQSNVHAQTQIVIHFGGPTTPPTDSGGNTGGGGNSGGTGGSGTDGSGGGTTTTPGAPPGFSNNSGFAVASSVFATSTPSTSFSSALAREITSQLSGTPAVTANFASAALGFLLPPGQASGSTTVLPPATNAVPSPDATTSQALAREISRQFPGAESIPYLSSETTAAFTFDPATAPVATANAANTRPNAVTPVKASQRLDRTIDAPADLAAPPVLLQAPVEEEEAPGASDSVPMATPVADEGPTSPWVWASVLGGAAVGTAWVMWHYWLKPTPAQRATERSWRNYLLGLDFNRL